MDKELIKKTAETAAQWWACHLKKGNRAIFISKLTSKIEDKLIEHGELSLSNDYDPDPILRSILSEAGVNCSGSFFSGKGIFPDKYSLDIEIGTLYPKEGYGNYLNKINV